MANGSKDKAVCAARLDAGAVFALGAGKSTIARNLLEQDPALSLSVSVTTRARRGSEIDGRALSLRDQEGV